MLKVPFFRSGFNYDREVVSDETGLACRDVSLAKQSMAEECDINVIVRRFGLTGQLPSDVRMPTYGDFSSVIDFHTAMNAIVQAREAFDRMPADVRYRFHNDAGEFVAFCSDDRNAGEAERLGLLDPEKLASKVAAAKAAEVARIAAEKAASGAQPRDEATGRFEARVEPLKGS